MTAVPPGIRTYSALLWVVGAIVIGAIATTTVVSALSGPPRWLTDFPWERENPTIATQNGSTWSAPGNAMIVLPDELTTGSAIEVRRTSGQGELLFLGQSPSAEAARDELPQSLGILDAVNTDTATFASPGTVLWVRTDGPWTLVIEPLQAETVDSAVSGTGTRYLRYDGPSNTAGFRHEGDGTITVEVLTAAEREAPVISLGVIDQQLTWSSSPEVVFHIIAEPGAVWSHSVDEGTP